MAHAFVGKLHSQCIDDRVKTGSAYWRHFVAWARNAYSITKGRIGYIETDCVHLGRRHDGKHYMCSANKLNLMDFDPSKDIIRGTNGEILDSSKPIQLPAGLQQEQ